MKLRKDKPGYKCGEAQVGVSIEIADIALKQGGSCWRKTLVVGVRFEEGGKGENQSPRGGRWERCAWQGSMPRFR